MSRPAAIVVYVYEQLGAVPATAAVHPDDRVSIQSFADTASQLTRTVDAPRERFSRFVEERHAQNNSARLLSGECPKSDTLVTILLSNQDVLLKPRR